ncbi:MAG: TraR/DksA family transcriptional regulator [Alphaproteobacteria bacterium]|nr:TraR/DksA family transcriptional regulator [Alphaproteobacteria bacterium]
MIDTESYKARLTTRLAELEARLTGIEADLDTPVNPDFADRATEREGDEVLESLGSAGLAEIKTIQAALKRIEDGSYGICIVCGEEISPERLDVVPHATNCRKCA